MMECVETAQKQKLLILDWDDTIVRSGDWSLKKLGLLADEFELHNPIGPRLPNLSSDARLQHFFGDNWEDAKTRGKEIDATQKPPHEPFPHIREMLEIAHDEGIPVAIASVKREATIRKELKALGWGRLAKNIVVVGRNVAEADKNKPNSAPGHEILRKLELDPETQLEITVVGDDPRDIEFAHNLRSDLQEVNEDTEVMAVLYNHRDYYRGEVERVLAETPPDVVIQDHRQIAPILRREEVEQQIDLEIPSVVHLIKKLPVKSRWNWLRLPWSKALRYAGARPPGGSSPGHLVYDPVSKRHYITKTGLCLGLAGQAAEHIHVGPSLDLLRQALEHRTDEDALSAKKKLTRYLPSNLERLTGEDAKVAGEAIWAAFTQLPDHPKHKKLWKRLSKKLQPKEMRKGVRYVDNTELSTDDIYRLYEAMVDIDPEIQNYIGLPALFDTLNGAVTQHIANQFQARYLPVDRIPEAKSYGATEEKRTYLGSKLLEEGEIKGLDQAIIGCFRAFPTIEEGKEEFRKMVRRRGLDGIFSATLLRLILGESSDNGPDNMLITHGTDGRIKVINIDLTGFRYDRRKDGSRVGPSQENIQTPGWESILEETDDAELVEKILDKDVLRNRYAKGQESGDEIHKAVLEVLREIALEKDGDDGATRIRVEVEQVREFFQSIDPNKTVSDFDHVSHEMARVLGDFAPDKELVDKAVAHGAKFVHDVTVVAKKSAPESHTLSTSQNSVS